MHFSGLYLVDDENGYRGRFDIKTLLTSKTHQGCIKRKTLIKDGRRPTISAWQRYWLQLWGSSLVFFSARSLTKGTDRRDFHSEPAKYQSIVGCLVMVSESGSTLDNLSFQLTDPVRR